MPNNQDFLVHYGVKGMKWGIRNYQNKDGTLTAEGRKRYGVSSEASKKAKQALSSVGNSMKKAAGYVLGKAKDKVHDKVQEKRGPEHLSDEELNERLNRLRKEAEYARLTREIEGGGNQNGGKKGEKKHPLLSKAVTMPVATAIGVGVGLLAKEKVNSFLDHRADQKVSTFMKAAESSTSAGTLSKMLESARRASETAGHPMQGSPNVMEIVNSNNMRKATTLAVKDSAKVNDFVRRTTLENPVIIRRPRHFGS